jgi:hypothetical protein
MQDNKNDWEKDMDRENMNTDETGEEMDDEGQRKGGQTTRDMDDFTDETEDEEPTI